jgi:hypothetical protein
METMRQKSGELNEGTNKEEKSQWSLLSPVFEQPENVLSVLCGINSAKKL